MPSKRGRHRFGPVRVGGRAAVQQGDQYVTNHFHVKAVYARLQEELCLPTIEELQSLRNGPTAVVASPDDLRSGKKDYSLHNETTTDVQSQNLIARRSGSNDVKANSQNLIRIQNTKPWSTFQEIHEDTDSQVLFRPTLFAWLKRGLRVLGFSDLPLMSRAKVPAQFLGSSTLATNQDESLAKIVHEQQQALAELLVLLAALTTYVVGRNVSPEHVSTFISRCRQDSLLPLITLILLLSLYRYRTVKCILPNPSLAQLTLEDAYGHLRPFSVDICADFSIFKQFLEFHYRDAASNVGESLVKAGQFNLTLGSRRGPVVLPGDWNREIFKPGCRVVNALYINKEDTTCLRCAALMMVTSTGEFHCTICQVYHRDYDTLRATRVRGPASESDERPKSSELVGPMRPSEVEARRSVAHKPHQVEGPTANNNDYNVLDFVHVDIRIQPRYMSSTPYRDVNPSEPRFRCLHVMICANEVKSKIVAKSCERLGCRTTTIKRADTLQDVLSAREPDIVVLVEEWGMQWHLPPFLNSEEVARLLRNAEEGGNRTPIILFESTKLSVSDMWVDVFDAVYTYNHVDFSESLISAFRTFCAWSPRSKNFDGTTTSEISAKHSKKDELLDAFSIDANASDASHSLERFLFPVPTVRRDTHDNTTGKVQDIGQYRRYKCHCGKRFESHFLLKRHVYEGKQSDVPGAYHEEESHGVDNSLLQQFIPIDAAILTRSTLYNGH